MQRSLEEITHMLFHALTEETLGARLDGARSQTEVYEVLKTLDYFDLSLEEFAAGIRAMQEETGDA